jgi:glycosyltransferase involved in cell wall biosynthesis
MSLFPAIRKVTDPEPVPLAYTNGTPVSAPATTATTPMTIAHVSTQRDWYGGEEQARLLANGLRERGHRCVVFARRGGAFASRMTDEGFEVDTFLGNGRHPGGIIRLRGKLAELKPNVVHFHDAHALTTGGVAAWGLGISGRVASRRCDYPTRFTGKYRQLCDRVVAVSDAVANTCHDCGMPYDLVRVVHDGVDPVRARSGDRARGRLALGLDGDDHLVLKIASLTPAKGHVDLLRAMPRLIARQPRTRLALAGDGDLRGVLQAEAARLGIADRVDFLGYRRDIPDLLHAADVFVLASRHEALGSSLIDAMLAKTPIITTTTGGIPELVGVRDGEPPVAQLVPPRVPDALCEALLETLERRDRRDDSLGLAEHRALERFTVATMVDRTLRVYEELLDG